MLSGESSTVPSAEAKALFLAFDPKSSFESPQERVLLVRTDADPFAVSSRIAFARRVGLLVDDPKEVFDLVRGTKVRVREFNLRGGSSSGKVPPGEILRGVRAMVDLKRPDYEFTVIIGERTYVCLSKPLLMGQAWSVRRPRKRAFFHPSAIFPKLARALVNLSRCMPGDVFLDPLSGTGSLPIEAAAIGARVVASDEARKMVQGSLANMKHFRQDWLGVVRADAFSLPFRKADAVATDVPYGRVSSTRGRATGNIIRDALASLHSLLPTGSRVVMMHPKHHPVKGTKSLRLEEEHHLYIHKRLTRTITVLRRM